MVMEAAVEFLWWVVGGVVGGWGGLQSHFPVQPNNCVEFVLCFIVVGAVTIFTDTNFFTNTNFTLFVLYMVCDSCTHQL